MTRETLYPDIAATRFGFLQVSQRHRIYWEASGRPDGIPVLFLHGGPGSGISGVHRRFFDPRYYRAVLFDQRGCGKSTPPAESRDNTTMHLLADIECLRQHLGIDRWIVFGGSWGSTLALAYGQAHPDRCLGFVLRGIFLGRRCEIDWFLHGMGHFFPEARRSFLGHLPPERRDGPLAAYLELLNDPDPAIHGPAAAAWSTFETACSTLLPPCPEPSQPTVAQMLSLSRLEAHYFANDMFLAPGMLLDGMTRIADKPAVIVQGRYDMICPIRTADALARAWPGAEYRIIPDAGHSALEPGIRRALIGAMESFKAMPGREGSRAPRN